MSYIDKNTLSNIPIAINAYAFISFLLGVLNIYFLRGNILELNFNYFQFDNLTFDFTFAIEKYSLLFLTYFSFLSLIYSIFAKKYFENKKEFIFTKQRFYTYITLSLFALFAFFVSTNIIQALFAWLIISGLIYYFSNFDLFKNDADYDTTRFFRINLVGDIAFFTFTMVLIKTILYSEEYLNFSSLKYENINLLFSYCYGILPVYEFKLLILSLLIAILSRLFLLPFNCYFSFLANSSNLFYTTVASFLTSSTGIYLFTKTSDIIDFTSNTKIIILPAILTIIFSLFAILFEKNLKIIFGYFTASINSLYLIIFFYNEKLALSLYLFLNFLIFLILLMLFKKDKISLHARLINKQKGFYMEKFNLLIFEKIPSNISKIIIFFDEKIFKYIFIFFTYAINFLIKLLVFKINKIKPLNNAINALVLFLIFVIISVIIGIFWGYKC